MDRSKLPNHKRPEFWPDVRDAVLLLAQEDAGIEQADFTSWLGVQEQEGNRLTYMNKGRTVDDVAKVVLANYRRKLTRAARR